MTDVSNAYELRRCLSRFGTGVTVVTTRAPEGPRGITVNAFTSVSLDPPLVLISISKKARTHEVLTDRPFVVNVLSADQEDVAMHFAGRGDPNLDIQWGEGEVGPHIQGAIAHIECRPWNAYDGGDHTLFLGEIVAFDHRDGDALGFFSSNFTRIAQTGPDEPKEYDPFEFELPYDAYPLPDRGGSGGS